MEQCLINGAMKGMLGGDNSEASAIHPSKRLATLRAASQVREPGKSQQKTTGTKDPTRFELVTYRTAADCSTTEL